MPGNDTAYTKVEIPAMAPDRARVIVEAMSLEELCGQVIMTGIGALGTLDGKSREFIALVRPGAILLFAQNIVGKPESLAQFIASIQVAAREDGMKLPPFVAMDHEGGSVIRIKSGVTPIPAASSVGAMDNPDTSEDEALLAARLYGSIAASELRSLGVTLNLAPVVEADGRKNLPFLAGRSYSPDVDRAKALSMAYIEGLESGRVAATAKHYPGNTEGDPHFVLPVLNIDMTTLERDYEPAFIAASRSGCACILLSHVLVPAIDPDHPVSLSSIAINGRIKGLFAYRGIVLTDDIAMKAMSGKRGPGTTAVMAIQAGADMVMASGGELALEAYNSLIKASRDGQLSRERLEDAAYRIICQKLRFNVFEDLDPTLREDRLKGFSALVERNRESVARFKR